MSTGVTAGFHDPSSQWHLAPNFTDISLSDADTIAYALDVVFAAKNKTLSQSDRDMFANDLSTFVKGNTIKHLHQLSDKQWDTVNCIPLICKIYLKHLLAQSFKYQTKQQLLSHDFNWGMPIDFNQNSLKAKIKSMIDFGFSFDVACEAVTVTQNETVDAAINYALLDPKERQKSYHSAKTTLNRTKPRRLRDTDYIDYVLSFNAKQKAQAIAIQQSTLHKKWTRIIATNPSPVGGLASLHVELEKYKQTLADLHEQRVTMDRKLRKQKEEDKFTLYASYVEGMLAGKKLCVGQVAEWQKYRLQKNISDQEHVTVLQMNGYADDDALDAIKTYVFVDEGDGADGEQGSDGESDEGEGEGDSLSPVLRESSTTMSGVVGNGLSNRVSECVVCFSEIAHVNADFGDTAWMIMPCNHVCLCELCAKSYMPAAGKDAMQCPMCMEDVKEVRKVKFS